MFPDGFCACGRPLVGIVCTGCRLPESACLSDASESECWIFTPLERSQYSEEWLPLFRERRRATRSGDAP